MKATFAVTVRVRIRVNVLSWQLDDSEMGEELYKLV